MSKCERCHVDVGSYDYSNANVYMDTFTVSMLLCPKCKIKFMELMKVGEHGRRQTLNRYRHILTQCALNGGGGLNANHEMAVFVADAEATLVKNLGEFLGKFLNVDLSEK